MRLLDCFLTLLCFPGMAEPLNFLILHPFYSGSHVLTLHSMSEKLIEKGHKVTTVRFRDQHNLVLKPLGPNHTEILMGINNTDGFSSFLTREEEGTFKIPMNLLWDEGLSMLTLFRFSGNPWIVVERHCSAILGTRDFIQTLAMEKFDLAVVDLIYNECSLVLAHALGLPTVGYWAFSFSGGECEFPGVSTPPSYIPAYMSHLTDRMSFLERVYNFAIKVMFSRTLMSFHCWLVDGYVDKYLKTEKIIPPSIDLISNVNGLLINSNDVLDYPRLKAESALNIGGLQIRTSRQTLPHNLNEWINGAENGVILFTMGFIFDPSVIPKSQINSLLHALSRLPYRIIMKAESHFEHSHDNILILPFVPQQDILAHPKTVAFFTHCGMHGVLEAIYFSVPMVGMPVFTDQGDVATRMKEKGIAKIIPKSANDQEVYQAVMEVSTEPRYRENVKRLSNLFKMGRHHPMEDAIWLLEYLSMTNGGKHMLPAGKDLTFVQYHSLDVIAFLCIIIVCIFILMRSIYCKNRKLKKD